MKFKIRFIGFNYITIRRKKVVFFGPFNQYGALHTIALAERVEQGTITPCVFKTSKCSGVVNRAVSGHQYKGI
ncbi:hypothetical protein [Mangrovibacterium sp.]|uniref:hypothetical protein n=1 Tax=Mangrovibacterium sp. TaxID=1961364 RepID=UPI00356690A6